MELTISLTGQAGVKMKLDQRFAAVKDFSPAFEKVGTDLLHFYGYTVFEQQGVAGEQWRGLSHETVQARLKHWGYYKQGSSEGPERKILVWTGRLRAGFQKEVTKNSLRIFNLVEYFKYHQQAGGRPPQRRMLAVTKDTIDQVRTAMIDQLKSL